MCYRIVFFTLWFLCELVLCRSCASLRRLTHTTLFVLVLEQQLNQGLLDSTDADDRCVWFRRIIEDIEESPVDTKVANYIDIQPSSTRIDKTAIRRMKDLVEKKLLSKVKVPLRNNN